MRPRQYLGGLAVPYGTSHPQADHTPVTDVTPPPVGVKPAGHKPIAAGHRPIVKTPAPLKVWHAYEVLLPGFDASSDRTDNLVLWIKSPDEFRVTRELPEGSVMTEIELSLVENDLDFTLPDDAEAFHDRVEELCPEPMSAYQALQTLLSMRYVIVREERCNLIDFDRALNCLNRLACEEAERAKGAQSTTGR